MNNKKLILIIPVYNGTKVLLETFLLLDNFFINKDYLKKIIFVNDGSLDDTQNLLEKYKIKSPLEIEVAQNKINQGKGASIKKIVKKENNFNGIIAFSDADIPYGVSIFDTMIKTFQEKNINLLIGVRDSGKKTKKQYTPYRYFFKKVFNFFLPKKIQKYKDTQSGIKAFDDKSIVIFEKVISDRWCFDVELLLLAENYNFKVEEVPVYLRKKLSKGGVSFLKHGLNIFLEMIKIRIRDEKGFYKN